MMSGKESNINVFILTTNTIFNNCVKHNFVEYLKDFFSVIHMSVFVHVSKFHLNILCV